jgi:hypothetical protein
VTGLGEGSPEPQNLALSRSWKPTGHLDLDNTYRIYHVEIVMLKNIVGGVFMVMVGAEK